MTSFCRITLDRENPTREGGLRPQSVPVAPPRLGWLLLAVALAVLPPALQAQAAAAAEEVTRSQLSEKLDEQLREDPRNLELLLARAQVALESGNASESLNFLTLVESLEPAAALLPTAKALLVLGAVGPAIDKLDQAIEVLPDNVDAKLIKALVQRDVGDTSGALETLRETLAGAPGNQRITEQLSLLLLSSGEPQSALDTALGALDAGGESALLHLAAGAAYAQLPDRAERGVEHLEKALELDPPDPGRAELELGRLLASLERHVEARPHLENAAAAMPESAEANFRLATTLRALGDLEAAAPVLERFEDISRRMEEMESRARTAGILLNEAQELAQANDLDAAAAKTDAILADYPNHPPTLLLKAKIRASQGAMLEAGKLLARIVSQEPANVEALFLTGMVERRLGNAEAAADAFVRALRIDGTLGEAQAILAGIRLEQGKADEARLRFERALQLGVEGPQLRYGYAQAFAALGLEEEAERELDNARRLDAELRAQKGQPENP